MKRTAINLRRTAGKVHGLAYELEHDAARLREMYPHHSDSLRDISNKLGNLARRMDEELASK